MSVNLSTFVLGIIDLGTVALRFDVYRFGDDGGAVLAFKSRAMPRLGEVLHDRAELRARVLRELERIKVEAERAGVTDLLAAGTMALREGDGAHEILAEVEQLLGMKFRVLSGEEEAILTAKGILSQEKNLPPSVVLIDIGGGSTEVSFCRDGRRLDSRSFPVGVLVWKPGVDVAESRAELAALFRDLCSAAKQFDPSLAVGSSGTIRSLERILIAKFGTADGAEYRRNELSEMYLSFQSMDREDLLRVPGIEASRADILLPGLLIFEATLEALSLQSFRVTHFSLRHGMLAEWLGKHVPVGTV